VVLKKASCVARGRRGRTGREAKRDSSISSAVVDIDHWFTYLFSAGMNILLWMLYILCTLGRFHFV